MNHKRPCCGGCTNQGCNATLYDGLGTKYAWIHYEIYDYQINGTTMAMTKKGSKLNDAINPCIRRAMRSKFYADLCRKYKRIGFKDIECYENEFFDAGDDDVEDDADETLEERGDGGDDGVAPAPAPSFSKMAKEVFARGSDCRSGYCGCDADRP